MFRSSDAVVALACGVVSAILLAYTYAFRDRPGLQLGEVLEPICQECGNDDAAEGYLLCTACLESTEQGPLPAH